MNTSPVTITTTGHAERQHAPNRCTVHLTLHADGTDRQTASEPVIGAAATITALVTTLTDRASSPVQRWTIDQVRHDRYRPYHRDGEELPWIHRSSASATVTFKEFGALGSFID